MKVQIRRSVFETNSSSTHSLQVTKGNIDDAKRDILNNFFDISEVKYESTIKDDKFIVTGLSCKGWDEQDVFTIISNWEAKLQYIASYIFDDETDEDEDDDELIRVFTKSVIDIAKAHGVTINDVVYNVEETTYVDIMHDNKSFPFENFDDIYDDPEKFINTIMDDNYIITYGNEAYSSFEGREIIVIK